MTRFKWLILLLVVTFFCGFLRILFPTKIIALHRVSDRNTFDVIIKYPPVTDKGKIQWWENNKIYFKEKYQVPVRQRDYRVTFWVADYKIDSETDQDSDLLCFDEMKSKANCIEKDNQPMAVWYRYDTRQILFSFDNGTTSYMKNDITGRMRQIE